MYFHKLDTDRDGTIHFNEFLQVFTVMSQDSASGATSKDQEEMFKQEFDKIDSKQDGYIDREELKDFYDKTMLQDRGELSEKELDFYFNRLDRGNKGKVTFVDFKAVMSQTTADSEMAAAPDAPAVDPERAAKRKKMPKVKVKGGKAGAQAADKKNSGFFTKAPAAAAGQGTLGAAAIWMGLGVRFRANVEGSV